jgi:hypothetical protein
MQRTIASKTKIYLVIFLLLLIWSCDFVSYAKICNQREDTINLKVNGKIFRYGTKETLNLIFISKSGNFNLYKLPPKNCEDNLFEGQDTGLEEECFPFDTMIVEAKNGIISLNGRKEILSKFKEDGNLHTIYNIY